MSQKYVPKIEQIVGLTGLSIRKPTTTVQRCKEREIVSYDSGCLAEYC